MDPESPQSRPQESDKGSIPHEDLTCESSGISTGRESLEISPLLDRAFDRAVSIHTDNSRGPSEAKTAFVKRGLSVHGEIRTPRKHFLFDHIAMHNGRVTVAASGEIRRFRAEDISYLKLMDGNNGYIFCPHELPNGETVIMPSPHLPESRHYPANSTDNTLMADASDTVKPDLFDNSEILRVHPIKQTRRLEIHGNSIDINTVEIPSNGDQPSRDTYVISQHEHKSCTGTALTMLLLSHQIAHIETGRYLQSWQHAELIKKAGLTPLIHSIGTSGTAVKVEQEMSEVIQTKNFSETLSELKRLTDSYGPAIIGISGNGREVGGHALILERISNDLSQVTLSDPWHGWCIDVSAEALETRTGNYRIDIVQAKQSEAEAPLSSEEKGVQSIFRRYVHTLGELFRRSFSR